MKNYFFRETTIEGNLDHDGTSFNRHGLVEKIFHDKINPSESGKDVSIRAINPFDLTTYREWMSWDRIELFEVEEWQYNSAVSRMNKIDELD